MAKMGRPTKYEEDMPERAYEYFNRAMRVVKTKEVATASGRKVELNEEVAFDFPSIAGLCVEFMVGKTSVYKWAKEYEEFANALDYGRMVQERVLTIFSLDGTWNAGMAKFLLINKHDYQDKIESNVTQTSEIILKAEDSDL